jgi:hypothetical protein
MDLNERAEGHELQMEVRNAKRKISRWCLFLWTALFVLACGGSLSTIGKVAEGRPNAARLRTGRFLYRTFLNGKDAGDSSISIRKLPGSGNIVYATDISGQFSQKWEAIATEAFVPISAKLIFGADASARPAFELQYKDGRVRGFALARQHDQASGERRVDAGVLPDTVDQRIDWAAAMSEDLSVGSHFEFHVFDPGTGSSRVSGRVTGIETVHVPAGTFEAVRIVYKMEKSSGTQVYQVLTNREGPRMLLKDLFPDGAVSELVEVKD